MTNKQKPLLMVAPLDWGLGHTTRVIPLIKCLLELGCRVIVACNSTQKALLELEFASLDYVELDGYNVNYGSNKTATKLQLLLGLPQILTKVKRERLWFLRYIAQNPVDGLISDNRYGLHHHSIPCVFLTHQLGIISGFGHQIDFFIQKMLFRTLRSFTECWVPDNAIGQYLAGQLSHPRTLPALPVHYIGNLSRFGRCAAPESDFILVIISGPEPQRTVFENIVLQSIGETSQKLMIVRGKPGIAVSNDLHSDNQVRPASRQVEILDHADARRLNKLACQAKLIIARSGYTTIMDMVKLKKKMVLVPTPGQSEQEYLARHLSVSNIAAILPQHQFSLKKAITLSETFDYNIPEMDTEQYKEVVRRFIDAHFRLRSRQ